MPEFSTIGLTGRRNNVEIIESLHSLAYYLLSRQELNLVVDDAVAPLMQGYKENPRVRICPRSDLHEHCDLVIVVGGDGSMLDAATQLAEQNLPVVGINRGRLGFLTDILPEEIENDLAQLLEGKYKVESRFLLDVSLERQGNSLERQENSLERQEAGQRLLGAALNDVVLHPGVAAQMIEFALYIDDEFVYRQSSDGLIIATPTGSTAYSMSAGGPIMHPKLDALVLVPMYPHSLSSRPIVIDGNREVTVIVGERHSTKPQISCDGAVMYTAEPGDRITVRKKEQQLKLLHPTDYNYYETCRSKLGWSHRPGKP